MATYTLLDLDELADGIDQSIRDRVTGVCSVCGEIVTQDNDVCEVCGTPVVWRKSAVWKRLFGSPSAAVRRLTLIPPDDGDAIGHLLLDRLRLAGFANASQKKRWQKARRNIPDAQLLEIVNSVLAATHRRGCIAHILNWTDKIIREQNKTSARPERPPVSIDIRV